MRQPSHLKVSIEDIRLISPIPKSAVSIDKDNMEYSIKISTYQLDALRKIICYLQYTGE